MLAPNAGVMIPSFIAVYILLDADALAGIAMPARASGFDSASAFDTVSRPLNAGALAGIAMPTKATTSNSI